MTAGSTFVLYVCALAALNYGLIAMRTSHIGTLITDAGTRQVVYAIVGLCGLFLLVGLLRAKSQQQSRRNFKKRIMA